MAVNSIKKAADGTPTQKAEETEFQSDAGSMHIKSTAVHNHIKNNVEDNLINFGLTNSGLRGSVETNIVGKLVAEGNFIKATGELNFGKGSYEYNKFRFAREDYNTKKVWENGKCRTTKIAITHSTTQALISKSESFNINRKFERSYSVHEGARFTINIPPYLDVAISDSSAHPNPKALEKLPADAVQRRVDSRYENARWDKTFIQNQTKGVKSSEETNTMKEVASSEQGNIEQENPDGTNYIHLDFSELPSDVKDKLERLPDWKIAKEIVMVPDKFTDFLVKDASPKVIDFSSTQYPPFKGKGLTLEKAKELGLGCRLQVNHGSYQTIHVCGHTLRTIRFNLNTTVDHGNVNLLYMGGKYEHIRGQARKLVEGSFIQHHRMPKTSAVLDPPTDAKVNYRFEDEASFAFVQPSDTQVNEIWALQLSHSGIDLGKVEATQGPRKFEHGFSLNDQHLKINHNSLIAIEANESIEFSGGNKPMKLDKSGLRVGGLFVRLDTFGPTVSVGRVHLPPG